jgi:exopolyphosphatase/guanosine-5'-triphosphate,3'-diphosphate pyrophosphatase
MKRIAVIDLGTNTFHLLITETGAPILPGNICKETIPVKLGEGGINQGFIQGDAFARGIKAMEKFAELIQKHRVTDIKAMATAALRSASNGQDFIAEVKRKTGIEIELIGGEKEAILIYKGVREAVNMGQTVHLIMDIGGGSVEFILCNAADVFWKKSYPLGAAKLMDMFHHSDPISVGDVESITNHFDQTLTELFEQCRIHQPAILIGSAGAFESFAELTARNFNPEQLELNTPSKEIGLDDFQRLANMLLASTHLQRSEMEGLIPLRVDMIVVATILTRYIISKLPITSLMLSDYSLKEGIFFSLVSGTESAK